MTEEEKQVLASNTVKIVIPRGLTLLLQLLDVSLNQRFNLVVSVSQ
jgi:hypothetical protein